jgi:Ni/Co efflux regulator RcnB
MTAKFISTMVKAASVVAVPLAILAASTPAGAQRPGQRNHSEWHYNNGRYDNWHHKKAHHKKVHYKNKNYKNGYYRNGRYYDGRYSQHPAPVILQRPVYANRGVAGKTLPAPQRSNRYPAARYPSSPVIPGFPTPITPNGRAGKVLPGTNQQYQPNNTHYRRY